MDKQTVCGSQNTNPRQPSSSTLVWLLPALTRSSATGHCPHSCPQSSCAPWLLRLKVLAEHPAKAGVRSAAGLWVSAALVQEPLCSATVLDPSTAIYPTAKTVTLSHMGTPHPCSPPAKVRLYLTGLHENKLSSAVFTWEWNGRRISVLECQAARVPKGTYF